MVFFKLKYFEYNILGSYLFNIKNKFIIVLLSYD